MFFMCLIFFFLFIKLFKFIKSYNIKEKNYNSNVEDWYEVRLMKNRGVRSEI